jgi:hypothetical protein
MNSGFLDKYFIGTCIAILIIGMLTVAFPEGASALLVTLLFSGIFIVVFRRYSEEKNFITGLFLSALIVRIAFGVFIHVYDLRLFFGGDSITYDNLGNRILDYWYGLVPYSDLLLERATNTNVPGWGINYLAALIYLTFGRNILAAQSFCAVFGAATAPLAYFCAHKIFQNRQVARTSAYSIAFFPSFVIWSSQLMKDGLIIFLLVLVIILVMALQERFSFTAFLLLVFSLFGILSLRFYIFYMIAAAVAGAFVIGATKGRSSVFRRAALLVLVGISLTYLGVIRNAGSNFDRLVTLEQVQSSRLDLAQSAESGFAADVDVSTPEGAIQAVPIGFTYLMLAPFPWQVSNLRQAITLPEVLVWWAMIPLMIAGIWFAIKEKLRTAFPILIFSLMLTLAYSIFQGNVGTAYRQRTQIQVFLFMFIAVGWTIFKERREDKRAMRLAKRREFESRIRGGRVLSN